MVDNLASKGLMIATSVGVISGAILGLLLINFKEINQLEFVEGSSLSIVTGKTDFVINEKIPIRLVNSGTNPLSFSNNYDSLKISGLDGKVLYSTKEFFGSTLNHREDISMVWDQTKNDGDQVIAGRYKITGNVIDNDGNLVTKSITINIYKKL